MPECVIIPLHSIVLIWKGSSSLGRGPRRWESDYGHGIPCQAGGLQESSAIRNITMEVCSHGVQKKEIDMDVASQPDIPICCQVILILNSASVPGPACPSLEDIPVWYVEQL